ncbi:MAG: hypothetical protein WD558_08915 [Pseudomonadales bacterium]
MSEYIVRAHGAPTDPAQLLAGVGSGAHVEYLAQIIVNTLFIAKGHRDDVTLTLVLEKSIDYSRALSIPGDAFGSLGGLNESSLLEVIADSLLEGRDLAKEATVTTSLGIRVASTSFEHIARDRLARGKVYLLDRKGQDVRALEVTGDAVFLLTDHIPMPRKLGKSLVRQGAIRVSLGPVMLHASQCVAVVQNELDRREWM